MGKTYSVGYEIKGNSKSGVTAAERQTRAFKDTAKAQRGYEKNTRRAQVSTRDFNRTLAASTRSVLGYGSAILGSTVGVREFFDIAGDIDQIGKLNARLGASTQALSEYRLVTQLTGVEFKSFTTGLQRAQRRIAEAAIGTGEARAALKDLGLEAKELNKLAPEDQFEAIAKAMESVTSEGDRVRIAGKLFDSEGVALLQTMEGGADAIARMRQQARDLGLSLSGEQVQQVEDFNDSLALTRSILSGVGIALVSDVSSGLTGFLGSVNEAATGSDRTTNVVENLTTAIEVLAIAGFATAAAQGTKYLAITGAQIVSSERAAFVARKEMLARRDLILASNNLAQARLAEAKATGAQSISTFRLTRLERMAEIQTDRLTAANTALAASATTARRALMLLGGPAGIFLLAAGTAFTFLSSAKEADRALRDLDESVRLAGESLKGLSKDQAEAQLNSLDEDIRKQAAANIALRDSYNEVRDAQKNFAMEGASPAFGAIGGPTDVQESLDDINKLIDARDAITENEKELEQLLFRRAALEERLTEIKRSAAAESKAQAEQLTREQEQRIKSDKSFIETLRKQTQLIGLKGKELAIERNLQRLRKGASKEEIKAVKELTGRIYDNQEALKETGKEADKLGEIFAGLNDPLSNALKASLDSLELMRGETESLGSLFSSTFATMSEEAQQRSLEAGVAFAGSFGSVAASAKELFEEESKGYEVLEKAEKAFRAVQLTLAVESALRRIFLDQSVTAAAVAGNAQSVTSAITSSTAIVGAKTAEAAASGTAAIANQGTGDPYTAFGRIAAMAAIMAGLGVFSGSVSGGDDVNVAAEAQARQGTGTVFGDVTAKSESIARGIDFLQKNADLQLDTGRSMLVELKGIHSNIKGVTSLVLRRFISGDVASIAPQDLSAAQSNSVAGALDNLRNVAVGSLDFIPFIGETVSGLFDDIFGGLLDGLFGKVSVRQVNDGIGFNSTTLAEVLEDMAIETFSFAVAKIKKKSFFKTKTSFRTVFEDGGDELDRQFGLILSGLFEAVVGSSALLGGDEAAIRELLGGFTLDRTQISLRGLSGDEIQEELEAIFGSIGDNLASVAAPEFQRFQQAGEGMFETLLRLSSSVERARFQLERFDIAVVGLDSISGTADVALELIRESLIDREIQSFNPTAQVRFTNLLDNERNRILSAVLFPGQEGADRFARLASLKRYSPIQTQSRFALGGFDTSEQARDAIAEFTASFLDNALIGVVSTDIGAQQLSSIGQLIQQFGGDEDELIAFASALYTLRDAMFAIGQDGQQITAEMIRAARGLEPLIDGVAAFRSGFFSEAEKFEQDQNRLVAEFARANQTLPDTREGFRALIEGLDLTTTSGQETYARLIVLSESLDDFYSRLEEGANLTDSIDGLTDDFAPLIARFEELSGAITSVRNSVSDDVFRLLSGAPGFDAVGFFTGQVESLRATANQGTPEDQIDTLDELRSAIVERYQAELNQLQDVENAARDAHAERVQEYEQLRDLSRSLKEFNAGLLLSDVSTLTPEQRFREAQGQFGSTLLRAQASDINALNNLQSVADAYLSEAQNFFASSDDFTRIFSDVRTAIDQVATDIVPAAVGDFEGLDTSDLLAQAIEDLTDVDQRLADLQQANLTTFNDGLAALQSEIANQTATLRLLPAQLAELNELVAEQLETASGAASDANKSGTEIADKLQKLLQRFQELVEVNEQNQRAA